MTSLIHMPPNLTKVVNYFRANMGWCYCIDLSWDIIFAIPASGSVSDNVVNRLYKELIPTKSTIQIKPAFNWLNYTYLIDTRKEMNKKIAYLLFAGQPLFCWLYHTVQVWGPLHNPLQNNAFPIWPFAVSDKLWLDICGLCFQSQTHFHKMTSCRLST